MISILALLVWAAAVTVDGDSACPAPAAVERRLAGLLPEAPPQEPDRARVDAVEGGELAVSLRAPDGTLIGARTLPATGSCEERARAAAVVLGTWASDVHPVFERATPPRPPAPVPPGPSPTAPDALLPARGGPDAAPRAVALTWDVGAGLLGGLAGGTLAPGGHVLAGLFPFGRWGGRLALLLDGERSVDVGSGRGRWSRWSVAVGPQVRFARAGWALDAHLSVPVGRFSVQGEGYPVTYGGNGIDAGILGGVRLVGPGAAWIRPWLALDAGRWIGRRTVSELVQGRAEEIPPWVVFLSGGASIFAP